jgi:hypothetical protein
MIGSTVQRTINPVPVVGPRHLRDGDHFSFAKCDVAKGQRPNPGGIPIPRHPSRPGSQEPER